MDSIRVDVNVETILQEVVDCAFESIPDGSGSSHFGGPSAWIFGLDMVRIDARTVPSLRMAVLELRQRFRTGPLVQTMINRLRPGGELAPHKDGLPDNLRFHLPLVTNAESYWWDSINGRVHMHPGTWYGPVPYCNVMHGAVNGGTTERIHVVCDFEREVM